MPVRISHVELEQRVLDALVAHGFAAEVAGSIAITIAACERDGTLSHGLLRLPGYIEAVSTGWASWTCPMRATPPLARPAYQAKKPRNIENRLT